MRTAASAQYTRTTLIYEMTFCQCSSVSIFAFVFVFTNTEDIAEILDSLNSINSTFP